LISPTSDREACVEATRQVLETGFHDPEGLLFCARNAAYVRAGDFSLELLGRVVQGAFTRAGGERLLGVAG
jgi:hypothetical protein